MERADAIHLATELMSVSPAAYLSTIGQEGFPETRAMLNLRNPSLYPELNGLFANHSSDLLIYFTTNTSSRKMRHIAANPKVCVYYARPEEWRGLMVKGTLEIVTDLALKKVLWQQNWTMYYPLGYQDPDYSILCLRPDHANGYQQMTFYTIDF